MSRLHDCGNCPAKGRGVFGALSESRLRDLMKERVPHVYGPGEALFYEGTPALAVYCIASGELKMWRMGARGEVLVSGTHSAGDLVGARAVVAGGNYVLTAQPLTRVTACAIPRAPFLELLRQDSVMCFQVLQHISIASIESERALLARSLESVGQRVARLLQRVACDHADGNGIPLAQAISRVELAHLVGTSPETLSRTLHAWAERGIVDLDGGRIAILDPQALERIAR